MPSLESTGLSTTQRTVTLNSTTVISYTHVYIFSDDGQSYQLLRVLDPGPFAYSAINMLNTTHLAVLYEQNNMIYFQPVQKVSS